MLTVTGNLWTYPADVRVITTNGAVKKNGECVMGRGCAYEAKQRWPTMPLALGRMIEQWGNVPYLLLRAGTDPDDFYLFSFPVKHHWRERADIELIRDSAKRLVAEIDKLSIIPLVVMPRPGCGNGGLHWDAVEPVLAPILDDRFHVITFGR